MTEMKAAVLAELGQAPQYQTFPLPILQEQEALVKVTAAALKQLDRAIVAGTHYASPDASALPIVCGTDGVGINEEGERVYFQTTSRQFGAMAQYAPVSLMVNIPSGLDDDFVAALMNPAVGAWLPLAWRAKMVPGEVVLVLGATGDTGQQALAIAKILGAKKVIAAGRKRSGLMDLVADQYIDTEQDEAALLKEFQALVKAGVDVIVDYLWGKPAELMMKALMTASLKVDERAGEHGIRYVSVGALAGNEVHLEAGVFRSRFLTLLGSGTGNFPPEPIFKEILTAILEAAQRGDLRVDYITAPLSEVASLWHQKAPRRWVFQVAS